MNRYQTIIDTIDTTERILLASWWAKLNYKMVGAMVKFCDFYYDGLQEEFIATLEQQIKFHQKQKTTQMRQPFPTTPDRPY